jgi:ketosteroid isomerase-like protein
VIKERARRSRLPTKMSVDAPAATLFRRQRLDRCQQLPFIGIKNATLRLMAGDAQSQPDALEASRHCGGMNMLPPDLVEVIEQDHRALDAIVRGDQGPKKAVFSHRDDVTLANPLGPPARGWDQVEKTLDRSVPQMRDGEPIRFERIVEYADGDLAYILEFERWRGKAGSSDEIVPMALRVTTIFRREDGVWKIALRQADPITTPRAPESIRDQEG